MVAMITSSRVLAGRYRVLGPLGEGGMAIVQRAHDEVLGRDVAVKVLRPALADDPEFVRRFRREAQHAAALHDPHIVTIHDLGVDPVTGADYIVMQLVDGTTLEALLARRRRLPLSQALRIAEETAAALQVAHDHGIVHRDVKPGNILLDREGSVLVADFGIARAAGAGGATTSGVVIGSAQYVSPEQVAGDPITPASDIYSLGVVLYELVTGQRPFDGPSAAVIALQRLRSDPPPPSTVASDVPPEIDEIVLRALARSPVDRYPSAAEMAIAIDRFRLEHLGGVRRSGAAPRVPSAESDEAAEQLPAAAALGIGALAAEDRPEVAVVHRADSVGPPGPEPTGPDVPPGPAVARSRRTAGVRADPAARPALERARRSGPVRRAREPVRRDAAATRVPRAVALMPLILLCLLAAFGVAAFVASGRGTDQPRSSALALGSPSPSEGAVAPPVVPTPSASSSVAPSASPSPTPTPTPTPKPTARATVRPAPTPKPPAATVTPSGSPAATVRRFYELVVAHRFDDAARLWTARMRRQYPPSGYINGRFSPTTAIDIRRLETRSLNAAKGTATVYVDLIEHRSGESPRHYAGTWDLVRGTSGWLMDRPHF